MQTTPTPLHLRPRYVLLVVVGGVLGASARNGIDLLVPAVKDWPVATCGINLTGSFALGLVLEALVRAGSDVGRRRVARLLIGTGFLGAYTTYSTLAVDAVLLLRDGRDGAAAGYLAITLVGGLLAAAGGVWASAASTRRRGSAGTCGPSREEGA